MRTLRLISATLLIVVLCLNFTSCSDDSESKKNAIILADDTRRELTFSAKEETREIKFTSSESWSAYVYYSSEDDWITVTPTEGRAGENTISIKVNSNSQYSYQGVTLGIRIPKQETQIYITQEGKEDILYTQGIEVAEILYELLGAYDMHKLKSTSYLNGADVAIIRKTPLTEIDLSDINIVDGGTCTVHYIRLEIGECRDSISDSVFPSYFFYDKTTIQSVVLPDTITMVDAGAFAYREDLSLAVIPNGVTEIGMEAFRGYKELISTTIPNSVTKIGCEAFQACESITSITIPNSVTKIANGAFRSCTNLTPIVIPNFVIDIDDYALQNCPGLTSIVIGNGIERLPTYMFGGCTSFSSIIIPTNMEAIETKAFKDCSALGEIHAKNPLPPTVYDTFSVYSHVVLYVPIGSKEAYQDHSIWRKFSTIIEE